MITPIINLIDSIFPAYKTKLYSTPSGEMVWGISKRTKLIFYKALCHLKSVKYPTGKVAVSYEILFYPTEEAAESEIDRLLFGYGPVTGRLWENDVMLEEYYE